MSSGISILDLVNDEREIELQPWMTSGEYEFILVTPNNITECIDACINGKNSRFALDLETTGIDNRVFDGETKDKIVGVCLSPDGVRGYYIPLRHEVGSKHNIPWSLFDKEFRRLMDAVMADKVVAIFHNGKFDQEFLECNGGEPYGMWDSPKRWEDTLILAYLRFSRAKRKSLKALSEAPPNADYTHMTGGPGLGMKMLELSDIFPEDHPKSQYNYALLDPSEQGPLIYGCSDAICTYKLCDLILPAVVEPNEHGHSQRHIYRIEKACVAATRWMERNRIPTDRKKVMELIKLGQQEWFDSIMDVYTEASRILGRDVMPGYYKVLRDQWVADDENNLLKDQLKFAKSQESIRYPNPVGKAETRGKEWPLIYDVNAPQQLGKMFDEMAVPGLVRTEKSGQVKTSKDVLNKVIEEAEARFPFMSKIKRFREVNKALSSYLFPMLEDVDPNDHTMRINFNAHKVDTGRFSTPAKGGDLTSDKKNKRIAGWPAINFQSIPATYDPRRPACMTRMRECVVARPNHYIVAIDFAGEELRLVTNFSREPKWLNEFFRCSSCERTFHRGDGSKTPTPPPPRCPNCGSDKIGDLHTLTALEIYGREATRRKEWKQLRGNAKGTNFSLCYGGGGMAVVRSIGDIDKQEGWRIKHQFDATYSVLAQWWKRQKEFAHKHGYVLTAFGRIYPVPDVWSSDGMWRSKAERNSINGPIQGTGADIIKIAMALIYKMCLKKGWLDTCRMIATMHDELVFEIHEDILQEAIAAIVPLMTSNAYIMGRKWPVPLTTDTEFGPDWTVKWDLNEMRHREVRFDGDKKVKEPRKPKLSDFDSPADFDAAKAKYESDLAAWEAMPHSFPGSLQSFFDIEKLLPDHIKAAMGMPPRTETEDEQGPSGQAAPVEPSIVVERSETAPGAKAPPPSPPRGLKAGDTYKYVLQAPLTPLTCYRLAHIIHKCSGGGTRKLEIRLPDGSLMPGMENMDIMVNDQEFYWMARQDAL